MTETLVFIQSGEKAGLNFHWMLERPQKWQFSSHKVLRKFPPNPSQSDQITLRYGATSTST